MLVGHKLGWIIDVTPAERSPRAAAAGTRSLRSEQRGHMEPQTKPSSSSAATTTTTTITTTFSGSQIPDDMEWNAIPQVIIEVVLLFLQPRKLFLLCFLFGFYILPVYYNYRKNLS